MDQDQVSVFIAHIRKNASRYFKCFASTEIDVNFETKQERPASILYRFSISSESQRRTVLVKVPLQRSIQRIGKVDVPVSKPDLFPKAETSNIHELGFTALKSISNYFSNLGEENLGSVRALDYLPEHRAIFIEESKDPVLRELFLKTGRFRNKIPAAELVQAFRNVGTWLQMYQKMSKEENVEVRCAHRRDYVAGVSKLASFLGESLGDEAFFQQTIALLERSALAVLPPELPLGLGHGDFAMRNILVGPEACITVIDTYAKWRTPIYEDIGYFLSALKLSGPQVISQGLMFDSAQLETYEQAFLEGYFEKKPIPYIEIRLFEMLSLLDKWSSVVVHYHRRGEKFKNFKALKALMANRYIKRSAQLLLTEISENRSRMSSA